jgi:hypothetical protein
MAMTACKECGKDVSDAAATCPHCGIISPGIAAKQLTKRESSAVKGFVGLLVLIFVAVGISRCSSDEKPAQAVNNIASPPDQVAQATPVAKEPIDLLKPEDVVKFPQSNIACLSKEGLGQVMEYSLKGEATKAQSMMIESGGDDAQCMMLDPAKKYRVIHVEYNDPEHPEMGVAEVVGMKIKSSSKGAWILTVMAQRVK